MQPSDKSWFRNEVLYQIYPRSFFDANNDGVGDLRGITQKLTYLKGDDASLGVGAIWISPFYPSPMEDFGYDVTDHCDVDPQFGTLDDFQQLLSKAHSLGIKVLIDFIPNHTSSQHPWFKEALVDPGSPKRNWYIWRDPISDGSLPNNWLSVFGGPAWEFDGKSQQYYLHSFLKEQPDLNWGNPELRKAMKDVLEFWLKLGVDGFRADAVYWLAKDNQFRDDPKNPNYQPGVDDPYAALRHIHSREGTKLTDYLNEITDTLKKYDERFMVIEATAKTGLMTESYLNLYENLDASICAPFNFEAIITPWKAQAFREFIDKFQSRLRTNYVPVYCLGNHDQPRLARRIGAQEARTAAMMQLTLPGMPVIYQGDELGMAGQEIPYESIQDPFGKRVSGMGRDASRTPYLWNTNMNAGFTRAVPWLPVDPNFPRLNRDTQIMDPSSLINLYRDLIKLRKKMPVLIYGAYESFDAGDNNYAYYRTLPGAKVVVILNFSDEPSRVTARDLDGELVMSTSAHRAEDRASKPLILYPHEGIILKLQ